MAKPRVGLYSMTCCEGCELSIIDLEDVLLEVIPLIDIVDFRLAQSKPKEEPKDLDVAIVEGSITTPAEIARAKKIRANCKILIAIGACACSGGIPTIKNQYSQQELESSIYPHTKHIESVKASGLEEYVKVDFKIVGCPIDKMEFVKFLKALLVGQIPQSYSNTVCHECKMKGNKCIFKEEQCIGAISRGGCGALCPSLGSPCIGCRGFYEDANIPAFVELMKKNFGEADTRRALLKFACNSKQARQVL
ncbi:MAG: oxidoreductase [Candidatus Micrarchaeota archaeon]